LHEVVTKAVQAAGKTRMIATTTTEAGHAPQVDPNFGPTGPIAGTQQAAVAGPDDCPFEFAEGNSSPQLSGLVSSLVAALISSALTFIG
jgi:hypothetical protein